jgi:hypothetical protein
MAEFDKKGGGFDMAVWVCNELEVNGYDDWFLPSRDELNHMYGNLHRKSLGGFLAQWYWSSTQYNSNYMWAENFASGAQDNKACGNTYHVRAIRQF